MIQNRKREDTGVSAPTVTEYLLPWKFKIFHEFLILMHIYAKKNPPW